MRFELPLLPRKDPVERVRLESGAVIGDFRLIRRLGQGSMGSVWEAEEMSLQRHVAFKVIRPECLDEKSIAMFEREGRASGKAHHSGIVAVYGRGEWEGVHYLVQELVGDGHTLGDTLNHLKKNPTLPNNYYEEVARFVAEVADAIEAAHQAGVIHRDIKPNNILIDDQGRPKITDFGLARIMEEKSVTGELGILGTFLYMSPEQAAAKSIGIDRRTDVFSLGVVLYEMLVLQRPFEGDTEQQILERILNQDPIPPRLIRSRVPLDLSIICMVALEKRREHRYSSMTDFAKDVRRYLDRQPILARPPGLLRRAHKWVLRHPSTSVGMSVGILALVMITTLLFQTLRAKRSAERSAADALASATLADQREQEASRERDASNRVTELLIGLFESSDPSLARGKKVSAKEILDRGAKSVASSLEQDPLVSAKLMDAMGRAYMSLGLFEDSEPLLRRALQDRQEQLGPDHLDTQRSTANLGSLFRWRGKYSEARDLLEAALEKQRRQLGANADDTLSTLDTLGLLCIHQGRYPEAESLLTEAFQQRQHRLGDKDPATLQSAFNLALLYREQGRYEEAHLGFQHLLETRRALFGEDDPGFLDALNNLASVRLLQGDAVEAERLYEEALEGRRRVLGEEHPETLVTINDLAYLYIVQGNTQVGEELYKKALDSCRRVLGEDHPYTLTLLSNLAAAYMRARQPEEAEVLFQQALEGGRTFLGEDHPDTLNYLNSLAYVYYIQKRVDEALPMFERALEGNSRVLGDDHPRTLGIQETVTRIYRSRGQYEKALLLARDLAARTPPEPAEAYASRVKLVKALEADTAKMRGN